MDIDNGAGVTANTLDPASKYGLAALSFDLQASGYTLPDESELRLTSVRDLLSGDAGSDAAIVHNGDGGLVDGGDGGALVKDGGSLLVTCAFKSLLGAILGTLGTFVTQCANVSVTYADGGLSGSFQNKCNNLGSIFTNNFTSGFKSCTGTNPPASDGGSTTPLDSGKASTGPTGTTSPTGTATTAPTSTGTPLVNLDGSATLLAPADAGPKLTSNPSDASGGTTITITINFNPPPGDSGTTPTDSGTPASDSGTSTPADSGAATAVPDAGVTAAIPVPYPATGFVVIDDAINTDALGVACTATMISTQVAVTSASCLWVKNSSNGFDAPWTRHRFAFGTGAVSDPDRNATREAVQVVANPAFDPTLATAQNTAVDIGYLFLLPSSAPSTVSVASISGSPITPGTQAQGNGYGLTSLSQVTTNVPNANNRKTFPMDVQSVSGATFHAQVDQSLALCTGDQGSGAYDDATGHLLGILTGSSVSSCAPGSGGTYLALSGFSAFQSCAIASVRNQTASFSKASSCPSGQ